jgi:hypothetical protein
MASNLDIERFLARMGMNLVVTRACKSSFHQILGQAGRLPHKKKWL